MLFDFFYTIYLKGNDTGTKLQRISKLEIFLIFSNLQTQNNITQTIPSVTHPYASGT